MLNKLTNKLADKWFLVREGSKLEKAHQVIGAYVLVFMVWGMYRLLFRMPLWVEEVILKGLVMGGVVGYMVWKKERNGWKSLGINTKNFVPAVGFGLAVGVLLLFFGELVNYIQYGELAVNPEALTSGGIGQLLILGLVTAFWEELLMMGYVLTRLKEVWENEWTRVIVVALMFTLLHLPVMVVDGLPVVQIMVRSLLVFGVGFGNGVMMLRTENLATPILTHALWGVSVFLFE